VGWSSCVPPRERASRRPGGAESCETCNQGAGASQRSSAMRHSLGRARWSCRQLRQLVSFSWHLTPKRAMINAWISMPGHPDCCCANWRWMLG
jgi:hypothetical protein